MLVTHWGLSGPAILKLSSWGARELFQCQWKFKLGVDWLPDVSDAGLQEAFARRKRGQPSKRVVNLAVPPLPSRLWEQIVVSAGIAPAARWSELSGGQQHRLIQQLKRAEYPVSGKSMNKEEFVTCGGVRLPEVCFKTMASRLVPGLYFAGEALDIDGLTGGFNFQAAWTTGWIAGRSMAGGAQASRR
jgi:predicted Rossmann fold flavoprotein